ncbi:2-haloacid dehalogenase [Phycisphaerales bacterium]|nr:2-haloacid dehalogenase [Phycisphaerales bacterium]
MKFDTIQAITFDCYGTLIDWEAGILKAIRPILAVHGHAPPDAEIVSTYAQFEAEEEREYKPYRDVLGGVMNLFAAKYGFSIEDRERERLASSIARWEPFPDTVRALRRLSERFRLVICSNIDDDLFAATHEKLATEFEWVVTAEYCRSYKPDPRHFRVALALLGLRPDEVLHAAQSRYHDIAPAVRMGFRAAWVNRDSVCENAGVTPCTPSGSEADLTVSSLAELARQVC